MQNDATMNNKKISYNTLILLKGECFNYSEEPVEEV